MTTAELADRIEAAEGPSRELDAEITRMLYREAGCAVADDFAVEAVWEYTSSIDDALTLVPEGWTTDRYHQGPSGQAHWWDLVRIRDGEHRYTKASSKAATAALALCAAAVRARATEGTPS
jgi:hypothetical protein